MNLPYSLRNSLENSLNISLTGASAIGGGCIHHTREIRTNLGSFFLKFNQAEYAHVFETEAKGLSLLRSAGEIAIPGVIGQGVATGYAWLVLEYVRQGTKSSRYWEKLGWQMAGLHRHTYPKFGLEYDNYIGSLPQQNHPHPHWFIFFEEERLRPMLRRAYEGRELSSSTVSQFEGLFARLENFFPNEPPALLHGDLWGGNILTGEDGYPVLIDPAVYYGHREAELAFMTLFDAIPQKFFDAYEEIYPLSPGYKDRFDIYNLYPLLVHVNLFGGGYITSVENILRRYV